MRAKSRRSDVARPRRLAIPASLLLALAGCGDDGAGVDTTPPSAVTDLAATPLLTRSAAVELTWTAPGGDGPEGTAAQYDLRYSEATIDDGNFDAATAVPGVAAPGPAGTAEAHTVGGLEHAASLFFALRTADAAANWSALSNVAAGTTVERYVQLTSNGGGRAAEPAWSPTGVVAYQGFASNSAPHYIFIVPAGGGTPLRITDGGSEYSPSWSPDGSRIAYTSYVTGGEIWTMAATGGDSTQITTGPLAEQLPRWSPDGSRFVYMAWQNNNYDLWTVPSTGGTAEQLTDAPGDDFWPSWSPDGTRIAFVSERSGNRDIWTIPATGGSPTQVTTDPGHDGSPAWSPDGSRIAFTSARGGNSDIWVIPATGGTAVLVSDGTNPHLTPAWSPDGARIVYEDLDNSLMGELWTVAVD